MSDLAFAGLARQAELVRTREVSPRELIELSLSRIERFDPQLNAFAAVYAEQALQEAEDPRPGALSGVPIAIKDEMDIGGEVTSRGTGAISERAPRDSEVVRRLRGAGAIVVGKTKMPELGLWPFTESITWGVTRNPWNTDRTPGGSSGGSAAAVAAGLCAAATGSDGAGLIRIPASACGLVGLKPQRGRVALNPPEHWYGLSVAGFVTRNVADSALMLDVAATNPPPGLYSDAAARPPGRLRVALWLKTPFPPTPLDDGVRGSIEALAGVLRALGHEVVERDPNYGRATDALLPRYWRGIADDAASMPRPDRLQRRTRGFARMGRGVPQALVRKALRDEATHAARINELFGVHDLLLTPVSSRPPVGAAEWEGLGAARAMIGMARAYPFTGIWNMTGQPAISVPAPPADGLPIGAQLIGPPDSEPLLLSVAGQLEQELRWPERRPPGLAAP